MTRFWLAGMAAIALSACSGGNPFEPAEETDTSEEQVETETPVPEVLKGQLQSFTYDKASDRLIVRGVALDDTPFLTAYRRRPGMDRQGYPAYTAQDGSLDRHYTAYVKEIDDTRASIVVSGGQFGHYFGGSGYERDGAFDAPTVGPNGGLVTYAGDYVGLMNTAGDGGDLLAVEPGTPNDIRSTQAAEITGRVVINADFADNSVNGTVFQRRAVDADLALENLNMAPGQITGDGHFTGDLTQGRNNKGTYGGIFGGDDAAVVAGTLHATGHAAGIEDIEEYGLFVLDQCGTANADALCSQPHP